MADDPSTPLARATTASDAADLAPDWAAYYRHTIGREPRPLFLKGMAAVAAARVTPGQAVEIGFGDGTETIALLDAGWRVLAIDQAHQAEEVLRPRVPADTMDRLEVRIASAAAIGLPPIDLIYAGYALSFLAPDAFRRFWAEVRAVLRPGGFVVVNVFGVRDTWAGDAFMTFVDRDTVDRMVAGLEVIAIDEEDADGSSFVGDKHWHVFDIIARRPILR